MRNQLLLLEDVEDLGRSGDVVSVKPGYCRNYLLPQKKAVIADKFTLRLQTKLQEERAKRAEVDRKDSEQLAKRLDGMVLTTHVKVDPDGHMYGSVSSLDVVHLFAEQQINLDRRHVLLPHPIKTLGVHPLSLRLKEGIPAQVTLHIVAEEPSVEGQEGALPT